MRITLPRTAHRPVRGCLPGHAKGVGAFWVIKLFEYRLEANIIDGNVGRKRVWAFVALLFLVEVEEAGVVSLVGQLEEVAQLWIYAGPLGQRAQLA